MNTAFLAAVAIGNSPRHILTGAVTAGTAVYTTLLRSILKHVIKDFIKGTLRNPELLSGKICVAALKIFRTNILKAGIHHLPEFFRTVYFAVRLKSLCTDCNCIWINCSNIMINWRNSRTGNTAAFTGCNFSKEGLVSLVFIIQGHVKGADIIFWKALQGKNCFGIRKEYGNNIWEFTANRYNRTKPQAF